MESSEEEDDFSYHEGITPQSKINSLYQSSTEKGIRRLCCELLDLKDCVENLCGNTRAKYLAFLRLSEEVIEMEHELTELRKHISAQGILIQDLLSGVCPELEEWTKNDGQKDHIEGELFDVEDLSIKNTNVPKNIFLEKVDILLAENKVLEAFEAFDVEERSSPDLRTTGDVSLDVSFDKSAFLKRKVMLEEQLLAVADQPLLCHAELMKVLRGLLKLGKGPSAHQIMLKRYGSRIRKRVEAFIPSCSLYPETYPALLSKVIFSMINLAAKESASTFGVDPIYSNKMAQWAGQEIESFVRLIKEIGPPCETVTALRAACVCVEASIYNCAILEHQGLKLSKLLMLLLRPYMDEVLEMNFRRGRRVLLDIAGNDDDDLLLSPRFLSPLSVFASSSDSGLISSGVQFISIVKDIVEQLTPQAILQFGGNVLSRISQLFDIYVDLVTKALPSPSEDDGITELKEALPFRAETDSQQLSLLGVAYSIVEDLLPMALSRIWNVQTESHDPRTGARESILPGGNPLDFKDWRRQLQLSLDKLRDHFCRQYVLNFIYSREGKARLDARIYIDEGENLICDSDALPSLPFQALFGRLQQLATVAGDVLLGKDKLQKVLLARLTETIVMWLSDEQEFWGVFEDESITLIPSGLQQLILDMHFTVEIARFAGYSSRQVLQLASVIIARAVKTFSARGIDPQSTLPEDEWFSEAAKSAINKLLLGASGSDVSEIEDEHNFLPQHLPEESLDQHIASDSDDTASCPSTVDSFHSFLSAEMGDTESPYSTDLDT